MLIIKFWKTIDHLFSLNKSYQTAHLIPVSIQTSHFLNKNLHPLINFNSSRFFAQMPGVDDHGRRVYIIKGGMHDPNVHDKDEMNKVK